MTIELKPMDKDTYEQYYEITLKEYAYEHVKAGNWEADVAMQNARKQFENLLPNGLETKDQYLFSVMNKEEPIGILWLYVNSNGNEKKAFIYDIKLDEKQRGKGFGTATMAALDTYAKSEEIKKIGLHVFAHNKAALGLYAKMGYEMTDIHMSKQL